MNKLILTLLLILLIPQITAFGVSPAKKDIAGYAEATYNLRILNLHEEDTIINLRTTGETGQFIDLPVVEVELRETTNELLIPITINVPKSVLPGEYTGGIIIEEATPENNEEFITAISAVQHTVNVRISPDGKFITSKILYSNSGAEQPVLFTVSIDNIGTAELEEVHTRLEIRGPTNEIIETFSTETVPMKVGKAYDFVLEWDAPSPGSYNTVAVTQYDGLSQTTGAIIDVGRMDIKVKKPTFGAFTLGEVVRVDMDVTSLWNHRLPGIFANHEVYKEDKKLQQFTSLSTDLAPRADGTITAYWNTATINPGDYTLKTTVHYGENHKTYTNTIILGVDSITIKNKLGMLEWLEIMGGAIILLIIILWIIRKYVLHK